MDDFEKNVLYKVNEAEQLKQEMTDEEIMEDIFGPDMNRESNDTADELSMISRRLDDIVTELHYLVHIFATIHGFKE